MRQVEVIMEGKQLQHGAPQLRQPQQQKDSCFDANANGGSTTIVSSSPVVEQQSPPQVKEHLYVKRPKSGPAKKWTSAFRVVQSMTRFKNMPKRHRNESGSRGSSFSGSNESTPTRCTGGIGQEQEQETIDPVYLALKQATAKYGAGSTAGSNGSRTGSRRNSQCALVHGNGGCGGGGVPPLFDLDTPSPRNLSQTSLQDSGYSGCAADICGSRTRLVSGSTPHLHGGTAALNNTAAGIGGIFGGGATLNNSSSNGILQQQQHQQLQHQQQQQNGILAGGGIGGAGGNPNNASGANGGNGTTAAAAIAGRRPKLSEKMKSLSLDCAEMPAPVPTGMGRPQYFMKSKPIRSARGSAASRDSFDKESLERSLSPPSARTARMMLVGGGGGGGGMVTPRRLPPAPQQQQQQLAGATAAPAPAVAAIGTQAQQQANDNNNKQLLLLHQKQQSSPAVALAAGNNNAAAVVPPPCVTTTTIAPAIIPISAAATDVAVAAPAPGPMGLNNKMQIGTHVVIHEYVYGDCALYLGDRLVVVENGDPDWKHGFKVNDRLEQLYTFPSTCVAAFQPQEQPMRLIQNCNLVEQKLRLYRDQVVFVQPNSLRDDGRVMIRNEHGTFAYCPIQFLMLL